jgi:hypothetical protein
MVPYITTQQLVSAMIYAFGHVSVEFHNCEKFYNLKCLMRLLLTIVDLSLMNHTLATNAAQKCSQPSGVSPLWRRSYVTGLKCPVFSFPECFWFLRLQFMRSPHPRPGSLSTFPGPCLQRSFSSVVPYPESPTIGLYQYRLVEVDMQNDRTMFAGISCRSFRGSVPPNWRD